jgi:hypothetical protein
MKELQQLEQRLSEELRTNKVFQDLESVRETIKILQRNFFSNEDKNKITLLIEDYFKDNSNKPTQVIALREFLKTKGYDFSDKGAGWFIRSFLSNKPGFVQGKERGTWMLAENKKAVNTPAVAQPNMQNVRK